MARKELLEKEKRLSRERDALAAERRALPWVRVEKNYIFDTPTPDGRWILFLATRSNGVETTIFLMPAAGGTWIPVTDGKQWDDKPRWSPDGKTIYFVSGRNGFYNVYGARFDSRKDKPVGLPFRVTDFRSTAAMIPPAIIPVELGISRDRLVVNVAQISGNIWVLDHAER